MSKMAQVFDYSRFVLQGKTRSIPQPKKPGLVLWEPSLGNLTVAQLLNWTQSHEESELWIAQTQLAPEAAFRLGSGFRWGVALPSLKHVQASNRIDILRKAYTMAREPLFVWVEPTEVEDVLHFVELIAPFADTLVVPEQVNLKALELFEAFKFARK